MNDTPSDVAFTLFLQMLTPAQMSEPEFRLFRYYRLQAGLM